MPLRCECLLRVTIDKSHGEHNESGLPPIATDARTLRHFAGVPISQVDNSACQTARYRRLTRGDREAMSRLRAISTMPAGSNLTLMQGSWPLRADIASPLSVRHAISRPRRHSHRNELKGVNRVVYDVTSKPAGSSGSEGNTPLPRMCSPSPRGGVRGQ
jgi:hypothetical protein